MCLSTVYRNQKTEDAVILRNVMRIDVEGDTVVLTDLMERTVAVQGTLQMANLVEGVVIVKESA